MCYNDDDNNEEQMVNFIQNLRYFPILMGWESSNGMKENHPHRIWVTLNVVYYTIFASNVILLRERKTERKNAMMQFIANNNDV